MAADRAGYCGDGHDEDRDNHDHNHHEEPNEGERVRPHHADETAGRRHETPRPRSHYSKGARQRRECRGRSRRLHLPPLHPRIKESVQDVRDEVRKDDADCEDDDDPDGPGEFIVRDGVEGVRANPRPAEDVLDDDGSGKQPSRRNAEDRRG